MIGSGENSFLTLAILEDEDDKDSKYITVKIPHDMVNNWIKCTPELSQEMDEYIDRLVKAVSIEEVQKFSDDEMDEFSEKHGFNSELQGIMIRAVIDLKCILGDEDFFDLYKIDKDINEDYIEYRWSTLNSDGEVEVVHDGLPKKLD